MKNTKPVINLAAIYEVDMELCSQKESDKWHARLRRAGFKRSVCKEAYYHPTHWESGGMGFGKRGPGDTWIMNDAFMARTPEAHAWLKAREEE